MHPLSRPLTRRLAGPLFAATAALCSAASLAAPPQTAYLERAQTQASGTQIRSFSVPTTNSAGVLQYWDVTVDLSIGTGGKPGTSAAVSSIKQVAVRSNRFVPGTYSDTTGGTCSVYTATLSSGRQEAAVSCTNASYGLTASVVNGDIVGHPYELQLTAASIGSITGYRDYAWGVTGTAAYSCFYTNAIVSARQIGPQIVLTSYGNDNLSDCGITLTQVP